MAKHSKTKVPPYPVQGYCPEGLTKWSLDLYNGTYNKLFPIRPWQFATTAAGTFAYLSKNPSSYLLTSLPSPFSNSEIARIAKVSVVSVAVAYTPVFILRRILKHFVFSYKGFLFEKKPSTFTKIWAFFRHVLVRDPILNSTDSLLPNLPVPSLKETVQGYLESMEPILSKAEYEDLCALAEQFMSQEGPKLQRYTWLWSLFNSNYVTPFWEKYAYLMNREQLMISSSVAHCDLFKDVDANQAARAAHIVYIEALSMLGIYKQQLKPLGDGLVCSMHYHRMYAGTRVPNEDIDHLESYGLSKHVAVYCKGCFYKVDLFDENNKLHSLDYLYDVFTELILRTHEPKEGEDKLAALTFDQRATWARNRKQFFLGNKVNSESLKVIETSMVFLSLDPEDYDYDPEKPEMLDNFLRSMLTGNGKNRWVDKSLNYVVGKNGRAGGTTEHAIADGAEFDHIMENFLNVDLNFLQYPAVVDLDQVTDYKPLPTTKLAQKLDFEINQDMISEINRCYDEYQPKKDDIDFSATIFKDFGKGLIKKGKCSPDAFLQMAIQLANYKDQGKFSLTYESASVRFYANSRTETLRSVTKDSCAFVHSMLDNQQTDAERLRLLRQACETHGYRNRMCMVGKGIDRHLFVLYVLSKGTNTSSPFLEHYISQPWLLSTSQIPTLTNQIDEDANTDHSWLGACFAAVAKDGYGICYRFAGNHSICAHVTSFKSSQNTDSHRFQNVLKNTLHEMVKLFEVEGVKL